MNQIRNERVVLSKRNEERTHLWDSWGVAASENSSKRNLRWRRREMRGLVGVWQGFLGSRRGSMELSGISSGLSGARGDLIKASNARRGLAGLPGSSLGLVETYWKSSEISRSSMKVIGARETRWRSTKVVEASSEFSRARIFLNPPRFSLSLSPARWN